MAVGVPLMVRFPENAAVTPAGKPVALTIAVAPGVVWVMVSGVLTHKVLVPDAAPTVLDAATVMVPVAFTDPHPINGIA